MKRFVVMSTGRSGSKRIALILRRLGLNVGHEKVFNSQDLNPWLENPGLVMRATPEWGEWDGDSSYCAFASVIPDDVTILHQTRSAPEFVDSFLARGANSNKTFDNLIERFDLFDPEGMLAPEWAANYWRGCNEYIRSLGHARLASLWSGHDAGFYLRYRIEDLEMRSQDPIGALRIICENIGIGRTDDELSEALQAVPETTNGRIGLKRETEQSWEHLPPEVIELGMDYGYLGVSV